MPDARGDRSRGELIRLRGQETGQEERRGGRGQEAEAPTVPGQGSPPNERDGVPPGVSTAGVLAQPLQTGEAKCLRQEQLGYAQDRGPRWHTALVDLAAEGERMQLSDHKEERESGPDGPIPGDLLPPVQGPTGMAGGPIDPEAFYTAIRVPAPQDPHVDRFLLYAVLTVTSGGGVGGRPYITPPPSTEGAPGNVKSGEVQNVFWDPGSQVLSFTFTDGARKGLAGRAWEGWTSGWRTWVKTQTPQRSSSEQVPICLRIPEGQAERIGPHAYDALSPGAAGSIGGGARRGASGRSGRGAQRRAARSTSRPNRQNRTYSTDSSQTRNQVPTIGAPTPTQGSGGRLGQLPLGQEGQPRTCDYHAPMGGGDMPEECDGGLQGSWRTPPLGMHATVLPHPRTGDGPLWGPFRGSGPGG